MEYSSLGSWQEVLSLKQISCFPASLRECPSQVAVAGGPSTLFTNNIVIKGNVGGMPAACGLPSRALHVRY